MFFLTNYILTSIEDLEHSLFRIFVNNSLFYYKKAVDMKTTAF